MERPADGQPPRQARQTTISAARAHGLRTASTSACPFSTLSSSGLPGEAGARGNTTPPSRSIRGGWVAPPEAHAHAPFNEHVHRLLVLGAERLAIMPRTAVLDRALATDHDLAARLPLHALLRVAARPDDGAEEVVARVLFDGHDELAPTPLRHLGGEGGGGGRGEGGVERPQAPCARARVEGSERSATFGFSDSTSAARSRSSFCRLSTKRLFTRWPFLSKMGSGDGERCSTGMSPMP